MIRIKKISLLIGLSTFVLLFYYFQPYFQSSDSFQLASNNKASSLQVLGTVASNSSISQTITPTAVLSAIQKGEISAEISTKVERIQIKEGHRVKAGDTLVVFQNDLFQIELDKTRGDFFKALTEFISELKLTVADRALEWEAYMDKALHEDKLPPLPNSLSKNKLMSVVRYNLHNQFSLVKQGEQKLEQCIITAPFGGIVSDIKVYPGATVSPGSILFSLTDLSRIRVEIQVLESDLAYIKPGARFAILNSPEAFYTVSALHPQIDEETRTGKVFANIHNKGLKYKDGQQVMVKLEKQVHRDRLVIPQEALLTRNDRTLVFVVKNGIAKWQYVKTGVGNGTFIEIVTGIAAGDTVVTGGHYSLAHDVPVTVKMEALNGFN